MYSPLRQFLRFFLGISFAAALPGCAHVDIYAITGDGRMHRVAHIESDSTNLHFTYSNRYNSVELDGPIDNSSATMAQGSAASNKIMAIGAGAAGIAKAIATHGAL